MTAVMSSEPLDFSSEASRGRKRGAFFRVGPYSLGARPHLLILPLTVLSRLGRQ